MGNQCICYNDSTDHNIKDLSNKINNENLESNLNQFENRTMLDMDIKNDNNNTNNNILSEKKEYTFRKNENVSAEDITKLNKIIRGHLFRKKFIEKLKQELENFQNELYNKFIEKSKNQKVENTLKENINLLSTTWDEFYDEDPIKEINTEISKIKKYEKGLIFNSIEKKKKNIINKNKNIIKKFNNLIN